MLIIQKMNLFTSTKNSYLKPYLHFKNIYVHLNFSEALPDVVVFPENTEQISKLLKFCNKNKIPVIPYGVGSGFEGGINAVQVSEVFPKVHNQSLVKLIEILTGRNHCRCIKKHE